ncbi:hypothetical protein QIW53_06040 [Pseudomonas fluorescens]|uniref:hypothetical protein n=1 Tax=Pseudomonas fluorescens TaxID=294 RepID=UPI003526828E
MNADPNDKDIDETPEYPLPSPTDSLRRDQRPPDDEDNVREKDKRKTHKIYEESGREN